MLKLKIYNHFLYSVMLLSIAGSMFSLLALDPNKSINQYGHRIWLDQNGLPAHAINAALQTRDGYLWLGTSSGLYLFDGVRFEEVKTNPLMDKAHESITALIVTRDSSLWIGTGYNGLRRFKNGKMSLYGSEGRFYNTQVRQLFEDKEGRLLIGTSNDGYLFDGENFIPVLPASFVTAIAEDTLNRIWFGTQNGIKILEGFNLTNTATNKMINRLPSQDITCIYRDRKRNIWIGTGNGLARWNNKELKIFKGSDGLSNSHINTVYQDCDDNIWAGTQKGISRLSGNVWTSYTASDGLSDDNVLAFLEDREGSLWVCTSNGLNQFRNVSITPYTRQEGLADNYISSIAEIPGSGLYFLSDKGASISHMQKGRITNSTSLIGPAYAARDSSLWIGHTGLLLNIKNGKLSRYDAKYGLPFKWITAIGEDAESIVFYMDDIGIRRFKNGRIKPYVLSDGREYSSSEYVACFYLDAENTFWIGTSRGLIKIKDGKSTLIDTSNGISGLWINSMFGDTRGNFWLSSPWGGITRYTNGKFTRYSTKSGLFTNEINCVLCDDRGDVWMSSPRGIGCVKLQDFNDYDSGRLKTLRTIVYTTEDGMKTDECFSGWQPAGCKTRDGRLWFATKKGAVLIDPKKLLRNELKPPVLIEKVLTNGVEQPVNRFASLSPGTENFEFHYTALSLNVPERVLFKYKLEGYDRDWVDAGTRRIAIYTSLPAGKYNFHVIACNNDGIWNDSGAYYSFELKPYLYNTFWFYCVAIVILGGIIFALYRLRVWQLLKEEKELNERIKEATSEIKTLGRLLPICPHCKKVRDDRGYWDELEGYVRSHSDATFSHSICPECAEKLYGKYFLLMRKRREKNLPPSSTDLTEE